MTNMIMQNKKPKNKKNYYKDDNILQIDDISENSEDSLSSMVGGCDNDNSFDNNIDDACDITFEPKWEKIKETCEKIEYDDDEIINYFDVEGVIKGQLPSYYFSLFCDNTFYKLIHEESIHYYNKTCKNINKKNLELLSIDNIKRYIGLSTLMGIVNYPSKTDYWSKEEVFSNKIFVKTMSRRNFFFINKFIHFVDNEKIHKDVIKRDNLYKIRPVFEYLKRKWISNKFNTNKITLDETMIPFNGRLEIKQYMPGKPNKYGVKMFCISDSYNGYLINSYIYPGKCPDNQNIPENLIDEARVKNCCLYCDNYFTSVNLLLKLRKRNINMTGVVRRNKKRIPNVPDLKIESIEYYKADDMLFCIWKDKRCVRILTNQYSNKYKVCERYSKKYKKKVVFYQPHSVFFYNKYARGVDRSNQLSSYYFPNRRNKRWYLKVFMYILEVTIVNSFIIYKNFGEGKLSMVEYKIKLVLDLIEKESCLNFDSKFEDNYKKEIKNVHNTGNSGLSHRLKGKHFIERKPNATQLDCKVCSIKRKSLRSGRNGRRSGRKRTRYQCKICQVSLCIEPCFEIYHTVLNLDNYFLNQEHTVMSETNETEMLRKETD